MMSQSLIDLLQRCTVKLSVAGTYGTGFFVAPGFILTCAHVVAAADNTPITVRWQSQHNFAEAKIAKLLPDIDVSLLTYNPPADGHVPCVLLDTAVESGDPLYLFGYPDQDFPNGCPATFLCEGFTGDEPPLIKFKLGQVRPGMSGSPLLNQRTGRVCGIVKFTRDRAIDLGGGAVPISVVLAHLSELVDLQHGFHQNNKRWMESIRQEQKQHRVKRGSSNRAQRNRVAMLEKVRQIWITDFLNRSFYSDTRITLRLVERPTAVERPMELLVQRSDQEDHPLPPGRSILDVYDTADHALLILGAPGAGKTTQLLELTRNLLDRAAENEEHPIPVIFPLSTWAERQRPLVEWLVDEMSQRYYVPREVGRGWVQDGQVLPLLDGLDEVREQHRAACIEAINTFRQHHGFLPLVVCSRSTDYEASERRLLLQSAVVVQPLTVQQVDVYLEQGGEELSTLRLALQDDPTLWELLDTPLMLQTMILTYMGRPTITLPMLNSIEERRRCLFEEYVDQMFKRRSAETRFPNHQQNIHWLTWLAQQMTMHGQTLFYIEHMQPDWLPHLQKWIPKQGVGILLWLSLILSTIPMSLTIDHNGINLVTTFTGIILLLAFGVLLGLLVHKKDIKSVEKVYWSWTRLKWSALHVRDFFYLTYVVFIFMGELFLISLLGTSSYSFFPITSIFLVPFLFIKGFSFREIEKKFFQNQGMHRSAKNALLFGIVIFMILATVMEILRLLLLSNLLEPIPGMITLLNERSLRSNGYGFLKGGDTLSKYSLLLDSLMSWDLHDIILIIFFMLVFGGYAVIQHFFLRISLVSDKFIPWRYISFLDYACDRIFLRKIGGGYIFIHRFLMEYFANLSSSLSESQREIEEIVEEKPKFIKLMIFMCFLIMVLLGQRFFMPEKLQIFPYSYLIFSLIMLLSILPFFIKVRKSIWLVLAIVLNVSYAVYYDIPVLLINSVELIYSFNILIATLAYIRCKELYFLRFIALLLILANLISTAYLFNTISFSITMLIIALVFERFFRRGVGYVLEKWRHRIQFFASNG